MLGSGCWTAAAWATTRWKKWAGVRQIWQGHDIDSGRLNVAGRTLSALLQFHITQSLNLSCEKGRFKDRDLIIWTTHNGSDAQHVPQWICYSRFSSYVYWWKRSYTCPCEINQCFACFEQREQNIFISSILNPPSVLLVSGFVLSLVASLSLYIRAVYQQEAQRRVL